VPGSILAGVFLVALAGLIFEVALTRAFSVLLRYHFVFLAILAATCGLGVGGLVDFLWLRRRKIDDRAILSLLAAALAVTFVGAVALLFSNPMAPYLTSLAVVGGVCIVPFICAGAFLSHAFAIWSHQGGRMYFFDLTGAALGSCAVIIALQLLGATGVPFFCAALAALAAVVVADRTSLRALGGVLTIVAVVGVALSVSQPLINLPRVPPELGNDAKPLFKELADPNIEAKIVYTDWNAFARTDVVAYARPDGTYEPTDDLYVYTDGEVPTNLIHFEGDLDVVAERYRTFIGFFPFLTARPDSVLLIGPGAGLDVLLALAVGASEIEGAELNPSMLPIVRRYRDFSGPLYDYENVSVAVAEGRSYVRRADRKYDLIYMALTKSATTASSSLALVESYVHTIEGFEDYLAHLTDEGQVAVVCQHPLVQARLVLTGIAALQREGMSLQEALAHVTMISVPRRLYPLGPYRHLVAISRSPLTAERSAELTRSAIALGFEPVFMPNAREVPPYGWLTHSEGLEQFAERFDTWWGAGDVDVLPVGDDRPFVIDFHPGIPAHMANFVWGVALVVLLFSLGTIVVLARSGAGRPAPLSAAVLYFALLGAGFMLVEVCLAQKLILYLGYPALTLSVILFALLIGGGAGSLFSQSWPESRMLKRSAVAALAVSVAVVVLVFVLRPMLDATLGWSIGLRAAVTMALLVPLGFAMGIPFPTGLREVGRWKGDIVPWAWGVNGVVSVLGSVIAMLAGKLWGFQTVLLGGAAIYALVFALTAAAHARSDWLGRS
jgi:spermidine synthase